MHECSYDENGTRRQHIEIYCSFVGKIDLSSKTNLSILSALQDLRKHSRKRRGK